MKFLTKAIVTLGIVSLGISSLNAATYIVQKGDTLSGIVKQLGFDSIKAAGIESVPSGDINLIYVGDEIYYISKSRKKRIHKYNRKIDLNKFCFKDAKSIHYRSNERCKPTKSTHKKQTHRKHKHH